MPLAERIAHLIAVQGPMSIAQFMTMALHDPMHGYYARRDPIGGAGDFITAPEVSQVFGELLGAWVVQVWRDQGAPSPARLAELGPGRGTLMADVLRIAKLDGAFLSAIEVMLVESSSSLREAQAQKLEHVFAVRWLHRLDHSASGQPLFVLANEFFDALPIRQFVFTEQGWRERLVGVANSGNLAFTLSPIPIPLELPAERGPANVGDIYQTCPGGEAIVEQIAAVISQHGGAALLVDYGYDAHTPLGETLQAVSRHAFAGVLDNPGEADLSAHVDFAALARAAKRGGAAVYGPIAQGILLENLGIRLRAEHLARANPDEAHNIAVAVRRLVSPGEMGTLFKALAILPQGAPRPPGF